MLSLGFRGRTVEPSCQPPLRSPRVLRSQIYATASTHRMLTQTHSPVSLLSSLFSLSPRTSPGLLLAALDTAGVRSPSPAPTGGPAYDPKPRRSQLYSRPRNGRRHGRHPPRRLIAKPGWPVRYPRPVLPLDPALSCRRRRRRRPPPPRATTTRHHHPGEAEGTMKRGRGIGRIAAVLPSGCHHTCRRRQQHRRAWNWRRRRPRRHRHLRRRCFRRR